MITFESVTKRFPDGTVAAHNLSFEVPEGELVVLVGPSGCGKTTALRMVNRMIEPTEGSISVNGQDTANVSAPTLRRDIGYVIQQVGLFPHLTVAANVATVPSLIGWDKDRTDERVRELIDTVGLSQEVANRYPRQLSGGQQQRVGVARALAADPPIMLMDEPFGAVDPIVRSLLQDDFVVDFLGAERNLKRLALIPVSAVRPESGPSVSEDDTADRARERAKEAGTDWGLAADAEKRGKGGGQVGGLDGQQKGGEAQIHP